MRQQTLRPILSLLLLLTSAISFAAPSRPNIVFLLTDDQSPYLIGYNNPEIKTPTLDSLAKRGVTFRSFYTNTAICMQSRATIMTGNYEFKHGCGFSHGDLDVKRYQQAYPALLRQAGYHTGFIGKFGYAVRDYDQPKGKGGYHTQNELVLAAKAFDFWGGWPGQGEVDTAKADNDKVRKYADNYPHVTRAVGATAQEYVREAVASGKPFSLSVSFKVPHTPWTYDPAYENLYPEDYSFKRRPNLGVTEGVPKQALSGRQPALGNKWVAKYDDSMGRQARMMHGVDAAVTMLVDELKAQKVLDNTVIIFCTDNGYSQGAHGFGGKVLPYQEATRSPAFMVDFRNGNSPPGREAKEVCSTVDIAPTILKLAEVSVPTHMDGKSLLPLFKHPSAKIHDDALLIQCWGSGDSTRSLSVVTPKWRYTFWFYGEDGMQPAEELYSLGKDPFELRNEANNPEFQSILQDMRQRYDNYVTLLKTEGLDESDYGRFKTLYDRNVPYEQKRPLIKKSSLDDNGRLVAKVKKDKGDKPKKKRKTQ